MADVVLKFEGYITDEWLMSKRIILGDANDLRSHIRSRIPCIEKFTATRGVEGRIWVVSFSLKNPSKTEVDICKAMVKA